MSEATIIMSLKATLDSYSREVTRLRAVAKQLRKSVTGLLDRFDCGCHDDSERDAAAFKALEASAFLGEGE